MSNMAHWIIDLFEYNTIFLWSLRSIHLCNLLHLVVSIYIAIFVSNLTNIIIIWSSLATVLMEFGNVLYKLYNTNVDTTFFNDTYISGL